MEQSGELPPAPGQPMSGPDSWEPALFRMVDTESLVPRDHMLRNIDAVLESSFVPDAAAGIPRRTADARASTRSLLVGRYSSGCCTTSVTRSWHRMHAGMCRFYRRGLNYVNPG